MFYGTPDITNYTWAMSGSKSALQAFLRMCWLRGAHCCSRLELTFLCSAALPAGFWDESQTHSLLKVHVRLHRSSGDRQQCMSTFMAWLYISKWVSSVTEKFPGKLCWLNHSFLTCREALGCGCCPCSRWWESPGENSRAWSWWYCSKCFKGKT